MNRNLRQIIRWMEEINATNNDESSLILNGNEIDNSTIAPTPPLVITDSRYFLTDRQINANRLLKLPFALLSFFGSLLIIQHVIRTGIYNSKHKHQYRHGVRRPSSGMRRSFPRNSKVSTASDRNHTTFSGSFAFSLSSPAPTSRRSSIIKQSYSSMLSIKTTPYQRLLVGLSCWDMLNSANIIASLFTSEEPGSLGCTVTGFLFCITVTGGAFYNVCLSLYFYCVIRFNFRDVTFAKYIEWVIHVSINIMVFAIFSPGFKHDAFNPLDTGSSCWAVEYPNDCTPVEDVMTMAATSNAEMENNIPVAYGGADDYVIPCQRGGWKAIRLENAMTSFFFVILFFLLFFNVSIFCAVRRIENRNKRFQFRNIIQRHQRQERKKEVRKATNPTTEESAASNFQSMASILATLRQGKKSDVDTKAIETEAKSGHDEEAANRDSDDNDDDDDTTTTEGKEERELERERQRRQQIVLQEEKRQRDKRKSRTRHAAEQSLLLCGGFFATYFPSLIIGFVDVATHGDTTWYYILMLTTSVCYPLQGFFDLLIYNRARYSDWRYACPSKGFWYACKMSILSVEGPRRNPLRSSYNPGGGIVVPSGVSHVSNIESSLNAGLSDTNKSVERHDTHDAFNRLDFIDDEEDHSSYDNDDENDSQEGRGKIKDTDSRPPSMTEVADGSDSLHNEVDAQCREEGIENGFATGVSPKDPRTRKNHSVAIWTEACTNQQQLSSHYTNSSFDDPKDVERSGTDIENEEIKQPEEIASEKSQGESQVIGNVDVSSET